MLNTTPSINEYKCLTLLNSLQSFLNRKYQEERKKALEGLYETLLDFDKFNIQFCKGLQRYPYSRKFDLVLVKYVQIELKFLNVVRVDSLKARILKVLKKLLHAIYKTEDRLIRAQSVILEEVKLLYIDQSIIHFIETLLHEIKSTKDSYHHELNKDTCIEIPVTAAIPTIEFIDDDNYFFYLEKPNQRNTSPCMKRATEPNVTIIVIDDDDDFPYPINPEPVQAEKEEEKTNQTSIDTDSRNLPFKKRKKLLLDPDPETINEKRFRHTLDTNLIPNAEIPDLPMDLSMCNKSSKERQSLRNFWQLFEEK